MHACRTRICTSDFTRALCMANQIYMDIKESTLLRVINLVTKPFYSPPSSQKFLMLFPSWWINLYLHWSILPSIVIVFASNGLLYLLYHLRNKFKFYAVLVFTFTHKTCILHKNVQPQNAKRISHFSWIQVHRAYSKCISNLMMINIYKKNVGQNVFMHHH